MGGGEEAVGASAAPVGVDSVAQGLAAAEAAVACSLEQVVVSLGRKSHFVGSDVESAA